MPLNHKFTREPKLPTVKEFRENGHRPLTEHNLMIEYDYVLEDTPPNPLRPTVKSAYNS